MVRVEILPEYSRFPRSGEAALAHDLAARLPRLTLEARRIATSLGHGIHGRRQAGPGESFWQFRPFYSGEAAARIDWRRSARDGRLYVREREWESAQTIELWIDRSISMAYMSNLASASKVERAIVLGLALAQALVTAGERVGYIGHLSPSASRRISEQIAQILASASQDINKDLPPETPLKRRSEPLLIGDFLAPLEEIESTIASISSNGAHGHAIMIVDPVEETFPFSGQTELIDPESGRQLSLGDAALWGKTYRQRITAHREGLRAILARHGFTLTIHHTDKPASDAALRILTLLATRRSER